MLQGDPDPYPTTAQGTEGFAEHQHKFPEASAVGAATSRAGGSPSKRVLEGRGGDGLAPACKVLGERGKSNREELATRHTFPALKRIAPKAAICFRLAMCFLNTTSAGILLTASARSLCFSNFQGLIKLLIALPGQEGSVADSHVAAGL